MDHQIELRPATSDDAPAIARLFRHSFRSALPHIPTLYSPVEDVAYFAGTVLPSQTVQIAFDRATGDLLGFIAFEDGHVNHLYVRPDLLRSGIGLALLQVAKDANRQLQLWTFQANANARAFYRSQGFRELQLTDGTRNEEKEPDVLLEWRRH